MKGRTIIIASLISCIVSMAAFAQQAKPIILPSPQSCIVRPGYCDMALVSTAQCMIDQRLPAEGYTLDITSQGIAITAADERGKIYAQQTLSMLCLQYHKTQQIPNLIITDAPRVRWRSLVLDTGPCYRSIATLKRYIDVLSLLKFNILQLNLTDGLGWRIEIKKYPRLASVGGYPDTAKGRSGYYTQAQLTDLVAYAQSKGITIVPCINSPGHSEAAQVAYPFLNCFDTVPTIPQSGFTKHIFCAGKDETLHFMQDVLDEVCRIFPATYIHLGGDEAPKDNWQHCPKCQQRMKVWGLKSYHALQLWYASQLAQYLQTKGRKAIFWGDVVYQDGFDLPQNVVIHWWNWRGHRDLAYKQALKKGLEVICGTNYYTYLNFPVLPWAGYQQDRTFDLRDVYLQNPSFFPVQNAHVLGMSACVWGDYTLYDSMLDSRVFPRVFALIEQMWHKGRPLPFETFYKHVQYLKPLFESLGYTFGPGLRDEVVAVPQTEEIKEHSCHSQ